MERQQLGSLVSPALYPFTQWDVNSDAQNCLIYAFSDCSSFPQQLPAQRYIDCSLLLINAQKLRYFAARCTCAQSTNPPRRRQTNMHHYYRPYPTPIVASIMLLFSSERFRDYNSLRFVAILERALLMPINHSLTLVTNP